MSHLRALKLPSGAGLSSKSNQAAFEVIISRTHPWIHTRSTRVKERWWIRVNIFITFPISYLREKKIWFLENSKEVLKITKNWPFWNTHKCVLSDLLQYVQRTAYLFYMQTNIFIQTNMYAHIHTCDSSYEGKSLSLSSTTCERKLVSPIPQKLFKN